MNFAVKLAAQGDLRNQTLTAARSVGAGPSRLRVTTPAIPPRAEPKASVRHFKTPEEYMAAVGFTYRRTSGRSPGGFKAKLVQFDMSGVMLRLGEASPATVIGAMPDCHVFSFATRSGSGERALYGHELPADGLCHHRPNELCHSASRSNESWPWGQIRTTYEHLEQSSSALAGRRLTLSYSDMAMIRAPAPLRNRLLRLVADTGRLVALRPETAASPSASRALSGVILEALVAYLGQGDVTLDSTAVRRHHQIMRRLDRVIEEHADEVLTLAQLCAAVGVAERTLHLVCHEFVGVGPMQYWRSLRLNRVRQALLEGCPSKDRVSEIAMHYGFWALGRFSVAYREAFGEMPSETLRRNSI